MFSCLNEARKLSTAAISTETFQETVHGVEEQQKRTQGSLRKLGGGVARVYYVRRHKRNKSVFKWSDSIQVPR